LYQHYFVKSDPDQINDCEQTRINNSLTLFAFITSF